MTEGPSDDRRKDLVAAIHATDAKLVLVVAGGGNAAITDLLDVPGASRTVLEVVVPYAESAMAEFLGGSTPAGAVSGETARALATAALVRAERLAPDDEVLGVACTATLVSDRPKKGDHRAHVAVASAAGVTDHRVDLVKGCLDRKGEDRVVADAVLNAVVRACRVA